MGDGEQGMGRRDPRRVGERARAEHRVVEEGWPEGRAGLGPVAVSLILLASERIGCGAEVQFQVEEQLFQEPVQRKVGVGAWAGKMN